MRTNSTKRKPRRERRYEDAHIKADVASLLDLDTKRKLEALRDELAGHKKKEKK